MSDAADVYRGFIDAVNNQDLDAADNFVDPDRYRENCIGFTKGFVNWDQAKQSIQKGVEGHSRSPSRAGSHHGPR